jgi:O-antigen/teichoic acid export membrane protein
MLNARLIPRHVVYVLAVQGPVQAANAVYVLLLVRSLGREGFGAYAAVSSLLSVFVAIAEQGVGRYITREIARTPTLASTLQANGMVGALLCSAAGYGGLLLLVYFLGYPVSILCVAAVAGMVLWLRSPLAILVGGLNATEKLGAASLLMASATILNVTVGAVALARGAALFGVFSAAVVANAVALGLAIWFVRQRGDRLHREVITLYGGTEVLRHSLPFAVRVALGVVYLRADVVMLSVFANFTQAGLYQSAYKIFEALLILPGVVSLAVFPVLCSLENRPPHHRRALFERHARYSILAGCLLSGVIAWEATPLVSMLFGAHYEEAAVILRWLSVALLLRYINSSLSTLVTAGSVQAQATLIDGFGVVVNLLLNVLLIPPLGARGAALSKIGSEIALLACLAQLSRKALNAGGPSLGVSPMSLRAKSQVPSRANG